MSPPLHMSLYATDQRAVQPRSDVGVAMALGAGANDRPKKDLKPFATAAGARIGSRMTVDAVKALPFMADVARILGVYLDDNAQLGESGDAEIDVDECRRKLQAAAQAASETQGKLDVAAADIQLLTVELDDARQLAADNAAKADAAHDALVLARDSAKRAADAQADLDRARDLIQTADSDTVETERLLDDAEALVSTTVKEAADALDQALSNTTDHADGAHATQDALDEAARSVDSASRSLVEASAENVETLEVATEGAAELTPYVTAWIDAVTPLFNFDVSRLSAVEIGSAIDVTTVQSKIATWGDFIRGIKSMGMMSRLRWEGMTEWKSHSVFMDARTTTAGSEQATRDAAVQLAAAWYSLYKVASEVEDDMDLATSGTDEFDVAFTGVVRTVFYMDYLFMNAVVSGRKIGDVVKKSFAAGVNDLSVKESLSKRLGTFDSWTVVGTRGTTYPDFIRSSTLWFHDASLLAVVVDEVDEESLTVASFGGASKVPKIEGLTYN